MKSGRLMLLGRVLSEEGGKKEGKICRVRGGSGLWNGCSEMNKNVRWVHWFAFSFIVEQSFTTYHDRLTCGHLLVQLLFT